jgi:hypothetical protein
MQDTTTKSDWSGFLGGYLWPGAIALLVPIFLYASGVPESAQLDDAAELTLVAREWSSAHPPGYPIWTLLAHVWQALFGVEKLALFSTLCGSLAALTSFVAFRVALSSPALRKLPGAASPLASLVAPLGAALAAAFGATWWAWSNTVEVYALQTLATALVLLGVALGPGSSRAGRILTGVGVGLGLSNHHLSMLLLAPFLPGLVAGLHALPLGRAVRQLLVPAAIAAGFTIAAYLLLMLRGDGDAGFSFGDPSTLSRLWHHVRGGFFATGFLTEGVDYAGRSLVYLELLLRHLWLFVIPLAFGLAWTWRNARTLLLSGMGFVALLLLVQWARIYTPNMDASVLPGLVVLSLFVAIGLAAIQVHKLELLVFVAINLSIALNYSAADRSGYEPGRALLADISASAPERSLLLLGRWELQTITALEQLGHDWRPDLLILPSSIKGLSGALLPRNEPEFFAKIQPQFDAYLAAIADVDADYPYTDYFLLETPKLAETYRLLVHRVLTVAREEGRPLLLDTAAVSFLTEELQLLRPNDLRPCGMLWSVGAVAEAPVFPRHSEAWLAHPFLEHDLCAQAVLYDYQLTAPQFAAFWRAQARKNPSLETSAQAAEEAAAKIQEAWKTYSSGIPAIRKKTR